MLGDPLTRRRVHRLDILAVGLVVLCLLAPLAVKAQGGAPDASNGQGPGAGEAQVVQPPQTAAETLAPVVRDTLGRFGSFTTDDTYGEVWIPTVTPVGWHPYPPCHWIKARHWGLYYDDPSEWGRIVHHYGRWVHDASRGWMWVPGTEFSPGWVVWRSDPRWTGWAPLPPSTDESITADVMAGADSWLFQETPLLLAGCKADQIAPPARVDALLGDTPYVTRVGFWSELSVFIVPSWIAGPFVKVDLSFKYWSFSFRALIASQWNFIWHHTTIKDVKNVCLYKSPKGI